MVSGKDLVEHSGPVKIIKIIEFEYLSELHQHAVELTGERSYKHIMECQLHALCLGNG